MNNYRINIKIEKGLRIFDYKYNKNFYVCRKYYPLIKKIREMLSVNGVKYSWWFFEPFIEITWLDDNEKRALKCLSLAKKLAIESEFDINEHDIETKTPKDGNFADWFCVGDKEMEFGAKRYAVSADLIALIYEYQNCIIDGKGESVQLERTVHSLFNQLGLTFEDERKMCFSRWFLLSFSKFIRYFLFFLPQRWRGKFSLYVHKKLTGRKM